jgi:hypothetical protein
VPPTSTPTASPIAPPESPDIYLKSSKVSGGGGKLQITVITSPGAEVSVTLVIKSGKTTVYSVEKHGQASTAGQYKVTIKVKFNPSKSIKARITVEVRTEGGSAVNSAKVTVVPHR